MGGFQISRILHAGYLFESTKTRILFDPIFENPFSVNCYAYPNVKFDLAQVRKLELSAIFISHYHDDHCSLESLKLLSKDTPVYVYCLHEELFEILEQLGFESVNVLSVNQPEIVGDTKITPRRALDDNTDTLFEIASGTCKVLNVVDSQLHPEALGTLYKKKWDLVLWPFQQMRESEVLSPTRSEALPVEWPKEWEEQLQKLQPRAIVPSSCQFIHEEWSWYRNHFFSFSYENFRNYIAHVLPNTKVFCLNPGDSLRWAEKEFVPSERLAWITPVGAQDVDYSFKPNIPVSETSTIAIKFPPLTALQKKCLEHFCQTEVIQRYKKIGPANDLYFQKKRHWRLSVFDHSGRPTNYFYQLKDEEIILLKNNPDDLSWTTEIAEAKLYGALENGESLSSLYLRINADRFSENIEKELDSVDFMQDPLLRTLYTGDPLSYQKAQLKRLQRR